MKHGIYVVLAFFKARSCRLLNHFLKDGKRQSTVCPDEVSPVIKKKKVQRTVVRKINRQRRSSCSIVLESKRVSSK